MEYLYPKMVHPRRIFFDSIDQPTWEESCFRLRAMTCYLPTNCLLVLFLLTLPMSYLGYETTLISNIVVNAGKETVLDLKLRESATELQTVVVKTFQGNGKPVNPMALVGRHSISMEEMNRLATGFNDPALITSNLRIFCLKTCLNLFLIHDVQ